MKLTSSSSSWVLLIILSGVVDALSSPLDLPYYIAAVVEHYPDPQASTLPVTQAEANSIIYQNLLTYQHQIDIENATAQGAQIIVFNEYGLFGSNFHTRDQILPFLEDIPTPSASLPINPCLNPTEFSTRPTLFNISCMAIKYNIYIVLDMGDVQACNKTDTNCPSDGRYQFNTLVAFGPDGELLAKYHKMHLYDEPYYDPSPLDPTYFDTNFGVRFGMLVCFDLIFTDPSRIYIENNVTDVVFGTEWNNVFPIISALQMQQGWSRVFNANLLASGTGQGLVSSGSGIYSQGELLATFFNPVKDTSYDTLLVAKVPKISPQSTRSPPKGVTKEGGILRKIVPYTHIFDATPGSSARVVGTDGALTCTFTYSVSANSSNSNIEKYVIAVYEAKSIIELLPSAFQYCGLVRCSSELDLCGIASESLEAATVFDSFSISGNFNTSFTSYPLLFTDDGLLLPPQKLSFNATSTESNGVFGDILLGVAMITMLSD